MRIFASYRLDARPSRGMRNEGSGGGRRGKHGEVSSPLIGPLDDAPTPLGLDNEPHDADVVECEGEVKES